MVQKHNIYLPAIGLVNQLINFCVVSMDIFIKIKFAQLLCTWSFLVLCLPAGLIHQFFQRFYMSKGILSDARSSLSHMGSVCRL